MRSARSACRCLRDLLFCLVRLCLIMLLVNCCCLGVPVYQKYFPEQNMPPVSQIRDGQSFSEKVMVMKMMTVLEKQAVSKHGREQWVPFTKQYVYEGDIILRKEQAMDIVTSHRNRKKRKMDTGVTSDGASKKWPMPIHYMFDGSHTAEQRQEIEEGVEHWRDQSCITFVHVNNTNDRKAIRFIDNHACYSYVGYVDDGSHQNISIGATCTRKGIVAHEIGHALGFWHEHAREDRQQHLNILWDNIILGQYHNFEKKSWEVIDNLAVPYDVGSVMHYSGNQFAKGGVMTIESINPLLQYTMGQREALSFYDVKLANLAYCKDVCSPSELNGACQYDGYQDPRDCSRCRCPEGLGGQLCETVAPSNYKCGGIIELRADIVKTITSPSYPAKYGPGLKCYWLIKSPDGTRISLQFRRPLMHGVRCNQNQPFLPCEDFVEVRFADNLGLKGGRFCCNDAVQREILGPPIVSEANHALVLFETYYGVIQGFQIDASIASCGGCHNTVTSPQTPCIKTVKKQCVQKWQKVVRVECAFNFWGCYTTYKLQTVERLSECSTEKSYCCHGYMMSDDMELCSKDEQMFGTGGGAELPASGGHADSNTGANNDDGDGGDQDTPAPDQDDNPPDSWTLWSAWSDCSVPCGGCGRQIRSRSCPIGVQCSGDSSQSQACGEGPCDAGGTVKTCSKVEKQAFTCGLNLFGFVTGTCYRQVSSYYTQPASCCCGHVLKGNVCVENTG